MGDNIHQLKDKLQQIDVEEAELLRLGPFGPAQRRKKILTSMKGIDQS